MMQFSLWGCLDPRSTWTKSSSDGDLEFIFVGIPKYLLGPNNEDYAFFSMNKVCSRMADHLLDTFGDIFSILESNKMMPQVLVMN